MPRQLGQIASISFKSACGFTVIEKTQRPSALKKLKESKGLLHNCESFVCRCSKDASLFTERVFTSAEVGCMIDPIL